jgi:hypothetical protein
VSWDHRTLPASQVSMTQFSTKAWRHSSILEIPMTVYKRKVSKWANP